jgi:DNA primase
MTSWVQDLTVFASQKLPDRVREALWSRGVSDDQIAEFRIGYLNRALPKGLPDQFLSWSKQGQQLDDVFVFPLTTGLGEIRGFQFRHVDKQRSGYQDFFLDQREPCLFGLGQAIKAIWDTQSVYLVEGVFDLFPIQRAISNVIATLTAYTNQSTVRFLRRVTRKVWIGYDMDASGRKGCEDFKKRWENDFEVYIVKYPKINGVKDPSDLWEVWGDSQIIPFIHSIIERENPF